MNVPPTQPGHHGLSPWHFGLLLALLVLAAFPQVILGTATFVARDFGFFAYPLAHFQRECFWRGELPFWDPYNNCGVPLLAQWNTMPLYPPALIYLTLPLHWSLNFFSLLHLWFAGLGMFFLARRWTGSPLAAAFAGTVFAFNGFTLNLLMWPSHMATFSWMPWVVLAAESAWRDGGKRIPLAALAGALQMLAGGPETIFLTWLIVSALWLQQFLKLETPRSALVWRYPLVVVLVFLLSAAQLLPFLDLVAHAQRESGYTDLRWSMPASGLANFLVPMAFGSTATEGIFFQHGQYWTSSYYLGIGALWLALIAVAGLPDLWQTIRGDQPGRVAGTRAGELYRELCCQRIWLLAVLSLVALLCALGENTPFYPLLRKLIPQLSFMTYPVKFVMVVVFAVPLLAAHVLAALGAPVSDPARAATSIRAGSETGAWAWQNPRMARKWLLALGLVLFGLIVGILLWTQYRPAAGDDAHAALVSGLTRLAFVVLTGAVLWGLALGPKSPLIRLLPLVLMVVAWLDVFTHEPGQNPTVPPGVFVENLARDHLGMSPQPELGGSRAMLSPAAALDLTRFAVSDARNNFLAKRIGYCADVNLLDAVPKVDGFFSLAPREFDGLLSAVYNVTNGNWRALEDFLGVSQYTSPTNDFGWQPRGGFLPLITAGQKPVFLDETNTLWELARNNFDGATMVFLPPAARSAVTVSNQTAANVFDPRFGNRTVDFGTEAAGPSLAVMAQTYYHDWQAEVDGQAVPLLRANLAFQAVQIPAGRHQVHVYYRDRAFEIGVAISMCMWINCLVAYVAFWRRDGARGEGVEVPQMGR
ncbi:MAG: YfhO family protein [Verrucomicrobiota bacterium]